MELSPIPVLLNNKLHKGIPVIHKVMVQLNLHYSNPILGITRTPMTLMKRASLRNLLLTYVTRKLRSNTVVKIRLV